MPFWVGELDTLNISPEVMSSREGNSRKKFKNQFTYFNGTVSRIRLLTKNHHGYESSTDRN